MKFRCLAKEDSLSLSLPVRGAWIEMRGISSIARSCAGRSPCGERGLK